MKKLYSLLLVLILILSCKGQHMISSLKDKSGNIWFSVSERGVYRYDGKSFVNFTKENYRLNINVASCIYEDKTGNLWFNTNRGLCYYDGKTFTDFKIPFPPASLVDPVKYEILLRNPIEVCKMLQDKAGSFWFLTRDHGVYRYDASPGDSVAQTSPFASFLVDETPNCILESKKGEIFIGSWRGGGVYRYDAKQGFTPMTGFSDGMISCMLEDKAGSIWVGTRNASADRYDPSAALRPGEKSITNFSKKDGLTNNNSVSCLLEDSKGNIWLGSDLREKERRGDVFCYDGKSFVNITASLALTTVEGFVYGVTSIIEDKAGNIWIGSKNGLLLCYDPSSASGPGGKKFTDFSEKVSK